MQTSPASMMSSFPLPRHGKIVFSAIGATAEYRRNIIRERAMAWLAAARARGQMGGRPKALDESQCDGNSLERLHHRTG